MKNLSFIFVALAFVAGAYLTSLDEKTVQWAYFIPVVVLGFIGAFIYKSTANKEAKHGDLLQNNKQVLILSMNRILKNLETLNGKKENIPTYDMRFEIDKLFRDDLLSFADARDSMKHLFGIQHFADIMSSFAAGERYINRVWSASTDGYVDEVLLYVGRAYEQFQHAQEEFNKALAEHS
ncbi:hypothetical protein [Marinicella rhabdoformis]|uniref:hypothetical protein n=1 Tax=Marinicella rhabdoformis TaxID=2580566 RepID=UPI0012AEC672|nr:hypothetical protein [Marinicella rhabdoformis]